MADEVRLSFIFSLHSAPRWTARRRRGGERLRCRVVGVASVRPSAIFDSFSSGIFRLIEMYMYFLSSYVTRRAELDI